MLSSVYPRETKLTQSGISEVSKYSLCILIRKNYDVIFVVYEKSELYSKN